MIPAAAVKRSRALLTAAALAGLAGCASIDPRTTEVVAQPKAPPVRNVTSFTGALKCMDDLFVSYGKRDIYITSAGIPDATGQVRAGTREMLISAISQMSVRSGAFRYVDYDQEQADVQQLHDLIDSSSAFFAPDYYIRGAVTQLDQGLSNFSVGGGVSISDVFDLGVAKNQTLSMVALDMNMVNFVSRQIAPGISSNNSIAIRQAGSAADASGKIKTSGVFFNISLEESEGIHQAVRTLVELGTIEILGKLTKVPYWRCLQIESTNPAVRVTARDWYAGMKPKEKAIFFQRALKGAGYYRGPVSGVIDPATSDAITLYQTERGLIPSGRPDFQLYTSLLDADKRLADGPAIAEASAETQKQRQTLPPRRPVELSVVSDRGARPNYRVGEQLALEARVGKNAYLACYYQDAQGLVSRIYPNRFQPNAFIAGDQPVQIPARGAPFAIRFDRAGGGDRVACLGSDRELALQLPDELKTKDLEPLPVASLQDLIDAYRRLDRIGLSVVELPITVR